MWRAVVVLNTYTKFWEKIVLFTFRSWWRTPYFSPELRVRIEDNNDSPHGKFHRFLFPFSSKFSDLNFASYVLYIYLYYVTCHQQWAWVTYGFASLSKDKMQFLTERHSGKTKQITNWSVLSLKGKLKFFRFKIVKYESRAFKRKIEIKPIPNLFILLNISRLPRTITCDIVVRFSRRILCTISPAMW